MLVVIDTNILVSALWSPDGAPAMVVSLLLNGKITPCYDHRILIEYHEILRRPKFGFSENEVYDFLSAVEGLGMSIVPEPANIHFTDEADKKIYEAAKHCGAKLITGNLKHFPQDDIVMTPEDFLRSYS